MSRPDFKTGRQHLTGGMPMGEYVMADVKCEVWRRVPMDWIVQELASWPAERQVEQPIEQDGNTVVISGSLDDALAYLETLR